MSWKYEDNVVIKHRTLLGILALVNWHKAAGFSVVGQIRRDLGRTGKMYVAEMSNSPVAFRL